MSLTTITRSGAAVTVSGPLDEGGEAGTVDIAVQAPGGRAPLTPDEAMAISRALARFAKLARPQKDGRK